MLTDSIKIHDEMWLLEKQLEKEINNSDLKTDDTYKKAEKNNNVTTYSTGSVSCKLCMLSCKLSDTIAFLANCAC